MSRRELVRSIVAGKNAGRCGFWLGMPHADTWPIYLREFGAADQAQLRRRLGDDMAWVCPQWGCWKHPEGKPMFETQKCGPEHGAPGVFAQCESVAEVEDYVWPDPDYLDFTPALETLRGAGDVYRASGMWCCFFHTVADYFGMDNYFVKMFTHPEVVEAATRRVCEFLLEANRRFYAQAGGEMDAFFIGNDFGTQLDLLVSLEKFDRFILPWYRRLVAQAHEHGYQALAHSCGAVSRLIDRFIEVGIDGLHPLQARAANMDAQTLARRFKGRVAFIGGVDTQDLLVNASPAEVKAEVRRLKALLGPNYIVSPSHECVLPNVPPRNVAAMAEAAAEGGGA